MGVLSSFDAQRDRTMKKYRTSERYSFHDFDKHMCLSPGIALWVVVGFLMRSYVIMGMSLAQPGDRLGTIDLVYPDRVWFAIDALAAFPAIAVVIAYIFRKPEAKAHIRAVWRSGRACLIASSTANVLVALASLALTASARTPIVAPVMLCVSVWCLWFLLVSRRVRDVFDDFPSAQDAE